MVTNGEREKRKERREGGRRGREEGRGSKVRKEGGEG